MHSDAFTPYEQGLKRLLEQLGRAHPRYRDALVFEMRLRENIAQTRHYGDTENRRAGRIEVLDQLNALALQALQTSFNTLCGLPLDEPPASAPPTMPIGDWVGGDKVAGDKVAGDKITIYQNIFKPTPPPFRTAALRMVEDYDAVFGGRDAELAILDSFLAQNKQPYTLLLAPTGRGKTALLIHWIARLHAAGDWHVIFLPVSLRYQTASAQMALGALVSALAEYHHESDQLQTYNTTPDLLRPTIADYLRRPASDGRPLLLVLDGLDEATGWQVGRDLFPRTLPPHLRIVVSARQMAHTDRTTWLERLGWRSVEASDFGLAGLTRAAVSDILRRMGNPLDQLATNVDLLAEIVRVSEGDPLTIRLLVEALQDGTLSPGNLTRLPPGLEAFVRDWLDELERHSSTVPVTRTLLGLCAVALGPLSSADLEQLVPDRFQFRADLNQAAKMVARFLIGDGSAASGYVFSHPRLRELFLEKVLSASERETYQQRFVAYGQRWYEQYIQQQAKVESLPVYLRQFWIGHLMAADQCELARSVLTGVVQIGPHFEQPWASARYAVEGSYAGYLGDLDQLWRYAEKRNDLALGLRCALITSSIRSLSRNLSPELLVGLVTVGTPEGTWTPVAALEHVRQMPDRSRQIQALQALLACGCDPPYPLVLEIVCTIPENNGRGQALKVLAPHLPPDLLPLALESARSIADDYWRVSALSSLAPHLPPDLLPLALETARSIANSDSRARALGSLAPHLPPDLLPLALESAHSIASDYWRASALSSLAPHLPPTDQSAIYTLALETARSITPDEERARALGSLAPHLPPDLLPLALETARLIANSASRARALSSLAPHLPPGLLPLALESAHSIADDYSRASALSSLAPHLPPTDQSAIYALALKSVRSIAYDNSRASALGSLAPHLPPDLLPLALESAHSIASDYWRVSALSSLAPHLPPTNQSAIYTLALETARCIASANWRVSALSSLAPHLPPTDQSAIYALALKSVRSITTHEERASALGSLAPHLPPGLLPIALETARCIADDNSRARALGSLAPHLPPGLLPIALETARCIASDNWRARALGSLASHLSTLGSLPTDTTLILWHQSIRILAGYGRPAFLQDLAALALWLATLASAQSLTESATAIIEIARCWP